MTAATVMIHSGTYRNEEVRNQEFPLHRLYDASKGYVTVIGNESQGLRNHPCRVKVDGPDQFEYKGDVSQTIALNTTEPAIPFESPKEKFLKQESEEDAMSRISKSFEHLDKFTTAAVEGIIRGLIVVGPPGIGKSHGVEQILSKSSMFDKIAGKKEKHFTIKGAVSAPMLYRKLYEYKEKDQILVLDDCDIEDDDSLNLLKGALDSCDKRTISWLKDALWLSKEDVPETFEYKGSVIFLTNIDFANARGKRAIHLQAIVSRCHYMDMEIGTNRDKLLRIKQIVGAGMLDEYDFTDKQQKDIVAYIWDNSHHMRELSLRMVKKIADLVAAFPDEWEDFAMTTCMLPSARYASLLADDTEAQD